jgi:hypothetical protein
LTVLFIIPAFFSLYYLLKDRQDLAFLNVYLPCLILLPDYYEIRVPSLPPMSAATWALLPLAISLLFYPTPRLELRRMDLWVTLFILSFAASELLREASPKDGATMLGGYVFRNLFAYIVARRLIEPRLRVATVQRIVLLFICLTPFILWEYRMSVNPWIEIGQRFFHMDIDLGLSTRNSHIRVQATFGHAILASMMFSIAFLMNCFLVEVYKRNKTRLGAMICRLERYHVPAFLLLSFLLLGQSRGPQLSTVVGYSILQIPRFRYLKLAAFIAVVLLAITGSAVYSFFDAYTRAINNGTLSETQQSAVYRRDLLTNYEPVAEKGGWLGYGALSVPQAGGQKSIDNAYLVTRLVQGKFGYYLFLLIMAECIVTTGYRAFSFRSAESRYFAFVFLAAMIGLFQALYTVYLGAQIAPVLFLLLGWSQSLEDDGTSGPKFHFKRLFA